MKKILLVGLVAGIAMAVVGMVLNSLWTEIIPGLQAEYQTPLFRPWSDPLMSLIFVAPIFSGLFMAWIWDMFRKTHDFKLGKKVLVFSGAFTIMAAIGMLMTYSCFPMSFLMLVTWVVSSAVQYYAGTWVLAKMIK